METQLSHAAPEVSFGPAGQGQKRRPRLRTTSMPSVSTHRGPFCDRCGAHVGTEATLCGACKRVLAGQAVWLTRRELRTFALLVRKHWGSGKASDLMHRCLPSYRPALVVSDPAPLLRLSWTAQELADRRVVCAERADLADLYDRAQAARGDGRRAVRL